MKTIKEIVPNVINCIRNRYQPRSIKTKLTRLRVMDTFARAEDGSFKVVGEEGFVAVDRDGNAIKLVDRLDFSNLNFNQ